MGPPCIIVVLILLVALTSCHVSAVFFPPATELRAYPNSSTAVTSSYAFNGVTGMAVDSAGNIYVADEETSDNGGAGRVVVLSSMGVLLHAFPNTSSAATSSYSFDGVGGVAVDSAGNIYVADEETSDNSGGGRVVILAGVHGTYFFPNSYVFNASASAVAVDQYGTIYAVDNNDIVVLAANGTVVSSWPVYPSSADWARTIAVDGLGNVYYSYPYFRDYEFSRVIKYSSLGFNPTEIWGSNEGTPFALATDALSTFYVTNVFEFWDDINPDTFDRLLRFSANGTQLSPVIVTTPFELDASPSGIAVGPGCIYVLTGYGQLVQLDANGTFLALIANTSVSDISPSGLAWMDTGQCTSLIHPTIES